MEKNLSKLAEEFKVFIGEDEEGKKKTFFGAFCFISKETGKVYLAYSDDKDKDKETTELYIRYIEKIDEKYILKPVERDEEQKAFEVILDSLQMPDDLGNVNETKEA